MKNLIKILVILICCIYYIHDHVGHQNTNSLIPNMVQILVCQCNKPHELNGNKDFNYKSSNDSLICISGHRVRVIEVPNKGEQLFSSVTACFIDEGRTQEVKSHQLLQLPAQFQDLPDQAVEIILCRAQPVDGEVDWNPKVSTVPPTHIITSVCTRMLFKTE